MKTDLLDIRNCDCMELLKRSKDNEYNLAICDVPYGIGEDGSKNKSRSKAFGSKSYAVNNTRGTEIKARDYKGFAGGDNSAPSQMYFDELKRVSKNQIIWGANHFISKIPFDSPCWIVWDKDNSGDFADCELAYASFSTAVRKFKFRWNGMLQENMKNKEVRIHPTQKPVALYRWLLQNYAKEGDKIFDSHMGSGSIAIACHYMGFNLTACELDADYYKAACERIDRETAQISLF